MAVHRVIYGMQERIFLSFDLQSLHDLVTLVLVVVHGYESEIYTSSNSLLSHANKNTF
jgi:hypothetical protein